MGKRETERRVFFFSSHCFLRLDSIAADNANKPLRQPTACDKQQLISSARRRPDSNRGEGAVAARLAILSSYPPNGGRPGLWGLWGHPGPCGPGACCPIARISRRQDSGSSRGGGLVIPSSLLRASAVCYVTVTARSPLDADGAVRPCADFAQGSKLPDCSELVCGAFVHLSPGRAGS